MIDMNVLVSQLIEFFFIICLGYLVFKIGIFNDQVNKHISAFILHITLPCMIVSSVLSMKNHPPVSTVATVFMVSIGFFVIMPIIAFIVVKILRKTIKIVKQRQGAYMFMLIFTNCGFMGLPILQAAFGENGATAVFYAAILNIFFNLSAFTYGILMIGYGNDVDSKINPKDLLTPGIVCAIVAILFFIFNISLPLPLANALDRVGDLTPAMAMLLVGSTLATMNLKEALSEWRIYVFCIVKQFILPILLFPLFRLLIPDSFLLNVIFIEFLMPIANTALMISTQKDLDYKFVSKAIFISTVMSLASIPLVMYLCSIIY